MKNNFMICSMRSTGFSENFFIVRACSMCTRARHLVFGKMDVEKRVFSTTPRHAMLHTMHHPLTCCNSIMTILHHIFYIKKTIYVYILLNAHIGVHVKENPWYTPGASGPNANFFPEF